MACVLLVCRSCDVFGSKHFKVVLYYNGRYTFECLECGSWDVEQDWDLEI